MYIDLFIVILFFAFLIYKAIQNTNSINSINTFALGKRTFSNYALTATIAATWVSGSGFFLDLSKTYTDGWYYLLPALCMGVSLCIVAFVLIPRMSEFLGSDSVASALGKIYGLRVRQVVAILATVGICGAIVVQLKAMSFICNYFFSDYFNVANLLYEPFKDITLYQYIKNADHFNNIFYLLLLTILITLYSCIGGITSVVQTDIVQKITFMICTVFLFFTCFWKFSQDYQIVQDNLVQKISIESIKKFDLYYVLTTWDNRFFEMLLLAFYFVIPGMNAASFQRVSMAINIYQAQKAWFQSAIYLSIFTLFISLIAIMLFFISPDLDKDRLCYEIINRFSVVGIKGIIIVGVLSMGMSTADSFINISSVILANDTYKAETASPLNKLYAARIITIMIGTASFALALFEKDLLKILITANSFYLPIVTPILIMAIFGYRSTTKCVFISFFCSLSTVITIYTVNLLYDYNINPLIPGIIVSLYSFIVSHFILEKDKPLYKGRMDGGFFENYSYLKKNKIYRLKRYILEVLFKDTKYLPVQISLDWIEKEFKEYDYITKEDFLDFCNRHDIELSQANHIDYLCKIGFFIKTDNYFKLNPEFINIRNT